MDKVTNIKYLNKQNFPPFLLVFHQLFIMAKNIPRMFL